MRVTTLLGTILGLKQTRILGATFDDDGLVVDVAPTTRVPYCSSCGRRVPGVHDRYEGRRWRHLDLAALRVHLRYAIRRVNCPRCGVTVELVPWAENLSWFTYEFEEQVAYLAQRADKTTLSTLMRVSWKTVGAIIQRVLPRHQSTDTLDGLTHIGVDELSYRQKRAEALRGGRTSKRMATARILPRPGDLGPIAVSSDVVACRFGPLFARRAVARSCRAVISRGVSTFSQRIDTDSPRSHLARAR